MKIISVDIPSQAYEQGVLPGDDIISVNGSPARDILDLQFYGADGEMELEIKRNGRIFTVELDSTCDTGLVTEPVKAMNCGNRCIFCFIDQNPPGMRKEIYVKDEDFRFSFLHGSYVTLTALRKREIERIIEQRLSPLYVSVHSTDSSVRKKLLGITREDRLLEKMDYLIENCIEFHCQIVVCPGINDGGVLENSIIDLGKRYPSVKSVAVVPVGLTSHRDTLHHLEKVNRGSAKEIIELVNPLHDKSRSAHGEGFVYLADEWFLRAGMDIPGRYYYDNFPQWANGAGMVRDFLDMSSKALRKLKPDSSLADTNVVFVTGSSMYDMIEDFASELSGKTGISTRSVKVKNQFYGDSVTVSGLLAGRDIIAALKGTTPDELVVLPPNCLNEDGFLIDNTTPDDIRSALNVKVIMGSYEPSKTIKLIRKCLKNNQE